MTKTRAAPRRRHWAFATAFLVVATGTLLPAQGPPTVPATPAPRREWPPPLDRRVALYAHDVSLREALDRLAAAAGLRFSYSSEALPLDRATRLSGDSAAVGDVLADLLRGVPVTPVIAGPDRVVLAPSRSLASPDTAHLTTARTLDRVVVTGKATGGPERALTVAVNVVRGEDLERSGSSTMSQAMDFAVPGIWVWSQSPTSLVASYGSIRGASSFGVSYPKVYIDGIEVANPLLLTQLMPESVGRIEVIRGPQGAALYGADAISGVVNVVTRHDGGIDGDRGARLRSVVGVSQTDFPGGAVASQEHALSLRGGSGLRTAGADIAVGSLGAFYEGASSRHISASGTTRIIGANTSFTGTARFYAKQAGASTNPLLTDAPSPSGSGGPGDNDHPQSVKQYTLGGTLRLMESERWTHAIVAGIDGYRLSNVAQAFIPFPSSIDSALRAAQGGADRATLRVSSVAQLVDRDDATASLTIGAEQSVLREGIPVGPSDPRHSGHEWESRTVEDWITNSGISAQSDVALRRTLYLTGGLRLERSNAFTGDVQYSLLPMLGAALVRDHGDVSMKLRVAYGKGIRAPRTALRETMMFGGLQVATSFAGLSPEEQAGTEAGLDLFVGRAFSFQLTRFDQRASGLIQQVPVALESPPSGPSGPYRPRVLFALQNLGAIDNRGWEMQGSAHRGPFTLSSAATIVSSRVRRLANGYSGDLRPGDRVFDVPAQTLSMTAAWTGRSWSAVVGGVRAFNWVDYDRQLLARAPYPSPDLFGEWLRDYWRHYNGVTRLRASLIRSLGRGVGLVVTGENLLGEQRGEPDNVTILPGRTIMAGVRANF